MKKKEILNACSILLLACACEQEDVLVQKANYALDKSQITPKMEMAIEIATDYIGEMLADKATRASSLSVASIQSLTAEEFLGQGALTRASNNDTLLYLINYQNDAGFALIGANDKLHKIYAISDTGNLYLSDTLYNKGLAIFFDIVKSNVSQSLNKPITDKEIPEGCEYKVELESYAGPYLSQYITKWS